MDQPTPKSDAMVTRDLHVRMEKSMEAIASFARASEEFKTIRKVATTPEARDRIDQLIKLNTETMNLVKRGLMITEEDIGRSERKAGTRPPLP